jgi:hypothetical protein
MFFIDIFIFLTNFHRIYQNSIYFGQIIAKQ